MPASLTRRSALGAGAVAAGALAVEACGGGDPPPSGGSQPGSGAALLGSLLALERAVIAAYDVAGEVLRGETRATARDIGEQEREHARTLELLIGRLGGDPPPGRPAEEYDRTFPRLGSQGDALRFLEDLEQRQVRAYLEALAELPELGLRRTAAEIGAAEGAQLAAVRVLDGRPASPNAFETGAL